LWLRYGLRLITKERKNMYERLLAYTDKLLQYERALIVRVNHQIKNIRQIEHSRHRSPFDFLVHLFAGLTAPVVIERV
jgi:hypothetical protein